MIEVLWRGRGGQGAFTAARLLGAAASMEDGVCALAFPSFGPERRGAPMRAFTKFDNGPIGDRSAIERADFVVYLDDTLFSDGWQNELKPGGKVLVNSVESFDDDRIAAIDANGLSTKILGRPIPNTVFLGALAALCESLDVEAVSEAIRQYMPEKLHGKNLAIVAESYRLVSSGDVQAAASAAAPADESLAGGLELPAAAPVDRGDAVIARLARPDLDPEKYAHSTCFQAGCLVSKNAGWRNIRPVIDEQSCIGCLKCYQACPDATVVPKTASLPSGNKQTVEIDLDFCKGCGICAKICPKNCISMVLEKDALAAQARAEEKKEAAR